MIDNGDGTIRCPKCGDSYVKDKPKDIFDKIAQGKRCEVCLGLVWKECNFN